jgi:hypothetical protein
MRVLNASHLADTGGNGIRTKRAFDRLSDIAYRSTCRQVNWLQYPRDLPWEQALDEWKRADVVHVRDGFQAEGLLGAPRRPTVIHHHGTQFRRHRDELLHHQRKRGAIGLAATLDLYLMAPSDLTWAPALYDLDALASIREEHYRPSGKLRIAHAPTNRAIKSTDAFLAAAKKLNRDVAVEVILVERTAWAECLRQKASADIYFDQVTLGYGNNAIEAWGMGIPVIAGAESKTLDEMDRRFGELPFLEADEGSIYEALRILANPSSRRAWGEAGRRHAQRFHSEEAGVEMLSGVYRAAVDGAVAA